MDYSGTDLEMKLVNRIIVEAVSHGGDSGGAFFSNGEKLNNAIMDWLSARKLDDKYTTDSTVYGNFAFPTIGRIPEYRNGFIYLDD